MKIWAVILASLLGILACVYYFEKIESCQELYYERGYSAAMEECNSMVMTTKETFYLKGRNEEKEICEQAKARQYKKGLADGISQAEKECEQRQSLLISSFEEKSTIREIYWEEFMKDTLMALRDSFMVAQQKHTVPASFGHTITGSDLLRGVEKLAGSNNLVLQVFMVVASIFMATVSAAAVLGLFRKRRRFR